VSPDRDHREALYSTLDSPGWMAVVAEIGARIRIMVRSLITDVDLPDHERRGYVAAIKALQAGVEGVYKNAGRETPPKIQQELSIYGD
jgi:hypothetical protein